MRYVDLHADTLTLLPPEKGLFPLKNAQITPEKLLFGGCFLQCFAVFCRSKEPNSWQKALKYASFYAKNALKIAEIGVKSALTIEDGGILEGETARLFELKKLGVKMFGFTWNDKNCLGAPCGEKGGLTPFGKETAEALFSLGILPDVSHLGDEGMEELFSLAAARKKEIVASHSLCRALCPHKRNLTDAQIKKIADSGGVIGVCFVKDFIGNAGLAAHVKHLIEVGGEDVVAVGSDFDGTENPAVAGADKMGEFFKMLERAEISERVIEKIALKNALRVLKAE